MEASTTDSAMPASVSPITSTSAEPSPGASSFAHCSRRRTSPALSALLTDVWKSSGRGLLAWPAVVAAVAVADGAGRCRGSHR